MYILDRIENEIAVIEYTDKFGEISNITISKADLAQNVREGDVLYLENGIYYTDKSETEKRRKRINEKLNNVKSVKKDPLKLFFRIYSIVNCVYLLLSVFLTYIGFYHGIGLYLIVFFPLALYALFGSYIHIAMHVIMLVYAIYNRIKWKVKKSFAFTIFIAVFSIVLNIYGSYLALLICRQ